MRIKFLEAQLEQTEAQDSEATRMNEIKLQLDAELSSAEMRLENKIQLAFLDARVGFASDDLQPSIALPSQEIKDHVQTEVTDAESRLDNKMQLKFLQAEAQLRELICTEQGSKDVKLQLDAELSEAEKRLENKIQLAMLNARERVTCDVLELCKELHSQQMKERVQAEVSDAERRLEAKIQLILLKAQYQLKEGVRSETSRIQQIKQQLDAELSEALLEKKMRLKFLKAREDTKSQLRAELRFSDGTRLQELKDLIHTDVVATEHRLESRVQQAIDASIQRQSTVIKLTSICVCNPCVRALAQLRRIYFNPPQTQRCRAVQCISKAACQMYKPVQQKILWPSLRMLQTKEFRFAGFLRANQRSLQLSRNNIRS